MSTFRLASRVRIVPRGTSSVRSSAGSTVRKVLAVAAVFFAGIEAAWAESPNVIVHGVDEARGRFIAEHAEALRREACASLLRIDAPEPWSPRLAIHVHVTAASFSRAVGGQPAGARGATSIEFAADTVSLRRIDVMGDGPAPIPDALAHELVHVVLADRFVDHAPPRWADEGLAMLFDSQAKQAGHDDDFRRAQRAGGAFTIDDILRLEHYPASPGRQRVFYGQSAALTRWLIARGDAATFVDFIDDASRTGVAPALQRHYGLESLASLDAAWKEVPPIRNLTLVGQVR